MDHEGVKSEAIRGWFDSLAESIVCLAFTDETGFEELSTLADIGKLIQDIEREIAVIESERNRYKTQAEKLRKAYGEAFKSECDEADIL